jgi:hypothetical protein
MPSVPERCRRSAAAALSGSRRIAARDSRDQRFVILDHRSHLSRKRQVQPAQAVEMAAVPADQLKQVGHARGFVKELVKGAVGHGERLVIARAQTLETGDRLPERRDHLVVGARGDRAHSLELDGEPQEVRLPRRIDVDAGDQRRMLRIDFDQPFLFEPHEGIAHGRLADAEFLLQGAAREQGIGLELQRQNARAQMLEDLRRHLPRAVQTGYAPELERHRLSPRGRRDHPARPLISRRLISTLRSHTIVFH